MSDRLTRFAPLTGVIFVVVTAVSVVISKNTPGASASGAKVIAFYQANRSVQQSSDFLFSIGFIFFLFFAGSLRARLRLTPAAEGLSTVLLAGATVLTVGVTVFSGLDLALADVPGHLEPAAAQALNVLNTDMFLTVAVGGCVFGIAAGLAILHSAQLPRWLGWLAILIGIASATPAGFGAFIAFLVWTLVVSIVMLRSGADRPAASPTAG